MSECFAHKVTEHKKWQRYLDDAHIRLHDGHLACYRACPSRVAKYDATSNWYFEIVAGCLNSMDQISEDLNRAWIIES